MTRHWFLRFLLHPTTIPCTFAFLLLFANLVPWAQVGLPVYLSPDSNRLPPCNGALEFGWPKTARVDEFIQYANIAPSAHYSINHVLGTQEFYVQTTRRSALTIVGNAVFCFALIFLASLVMRIIADLKLSLKSSFLFVTLIGILFGSFACGNLLSKSDHMESRLDWYTTEKWPAAFPD